MLCQQINTKPCSSAAGHAPRSTLNHSNSQAFAPSPRKESSAAPDSSVTRWSWRLLPLPAAFSSRRSRSLELLCLNAEHRARFRASNSSSEEKRSLSEQTWVSGGAVQEAARSSPSSAPSSSRVCLHPSSRHLPAPAAAWHRLPPSPRPSSRGQRPIWCFHLGTSWASLKVLCGKGGEERTWLRALHRPSGSPQRLEGPQNPRCYPLTWRGRI